MFTRRIRTAIRLPPPHHHQYQHIHARIHTHTHTPIVFFFESGIAGDETIVTLNRNELNEERIKTELTEDSNFTVLLESVAENVYLGSGILIKNVQGHIWVVTAAHCVASLETAKVKKFNAARIRCPIFEIYNNDPKPHARYKKKDHRFHDYYVEREAMFIYPLYYEDASCRNGTDIGTFFSNFLFFVFHKLWFWYTGCQNITIGGKGMNIPLLFGTKLCYTDTWNQKTF